MKYLLHLAYKGTNYRGYQRQADAKSVQQTIEECLMRLLKEKLFIVGCGRTDAGVHSSNYVAHVKVKKPLKEDFLFVINKVLPRDIVIKDVIPVGDHSQAQFHAIGRRYDYYLHTKADPILSDFSTLYEGYKLDIDAMREAANMLLGTHDFISFCKQPEKHDNTICTIEECMIYNRGHSIQVRIKGNRFLRSMVRLTVGNLLEISRGNMKIETWKAALHNKVAFPEFNQAFPQGLQLSGVYYPSRTFDEEPPYSLAGLTT